VSIQKLINMKVLAITGGIGSGKSFIVNMFSVLGVPVYIADDRTKSLYFTDKNLHEKLNKLFGEEIIENGILRKEFMSNKIFNDIELLKQIEQLVHPAVIKDFLRWKEIERHFGTHFVIFESAIFLENKTFRLLADDILLVTAPLETRIQRVMKRDGISKEQILLRMNNQWTENQMKKFMNYEINNDGQTKLLPIVEQMIENYG